MTNAPPSRSKKLHVERNDFLRCMTAFRDLSNAMTAYQNGTGPAPLVSEYEAWRDLVAIVKGGRQE